MLTLRLFVRMALLAGIGACSPSAASPAQSPLPDISTTDSHISLFSYPWIWTDEQGQSVAFSKWRGLSMVVTAMYTQCRATCPRTIAKLRQLDQTFRLEHRAVEFVLVTLDPASDSPERLRRFKASERLPDSWHLLTGPMPMTRELSDLLDIHVVGGGPHLVHNARIVVFDRAGFPVHVFSGFSLDEEVDVADNSFFD
jgi:protein SCO1/2